MFIRLAKSLAIPATLAQAHALRKAIPAPHPTAAQIAAGADPGISNGQLRAGLKNLYGFTALKYGTSFAGFWTAFVPGTVAAITGKMGAFPAGHRLRRFDPSFTGYHKVAVMRLSSADEAWWDNPLAATGTYKGEPVTKAELKTYIEAAIAAGGAWIVAPIKQPAPPPAPIPPPEPAPAPEPIPIPEPTPTPEPTPEPPDLPVPHKKHLPHVAPTPPHGPTRPI